MESLTNTIYGYEIYNTKCEKNHTNTLSQEEEERLKGILISHNSALMTIMDRIAVMEHIVSDPFPYVCGMYEYTPMMNVLDEAAKYYAYDADLIQKINYLKNMEEWMRTFNVVGSIHVGKEEGIHYSSSQLMYGILDRKIAVFEVYPSPDKNTANRILYRELPHDPDKWIKQPIVRYIDRFIISDWDDEIIITNKEAAVELSAAACDDNENRSYIRFIGREKGLD